MQQTKITPRPRYVGEAPHYTLRGEWHRVTSGMARGVTMRPCLNLTVSAVWPFMQLRRAWRIELHHSRLPRWETLAVVPEWVTASQLYLEAEQAQALARDPQRARRAARLDLANAVREARLWQRPDTKLRATQAKRDRYKVAVELLRFQN